MQKKCRSTLTGIARASCCNLACHTPASRSCTQVEFADATVLHLRTAAGGTLNDRDILAKLPTLSGPLSLAVDVNLGRGLKHMQHVASRSCLGLGLGGFQKKCTD